MTLINNAKKLEDYLNLTDEENKKLNREAAKELKEIENAYLYREKGIRSFEEEEKRV